MPLFSPAFSPALITDSLSPSLVNLNVDPSVRVPSNIEQTASPTSIIAFGLLEVDLNSAMVLDTSNEEEASSMVNVGSYFALVGVVLLEMVAVLSAGILTGRLWQHRRERWEGLSQREKNQDEVLSNKVQGAWGFRDVEEHSFDRRLREMD